MIATTDDFTSHVSAHAGIGESFAERVSRVVLAGLGGYLSPAHRELLAEELPAALGAVVLAGAAGDHRSRPIEAEVIALGTSAGRARELIASVCRVLGEELSSEALRAIRAAAPAGIAALLAGSAEELVAQPAAPSTHDTLAAGRPGSSHPLYEAPGPAAQTDSVASANNPHAATKLSSSPGSTQERRRETLADGHPGSPHPLSGTRR